jgi:hypothetical protein
LERVWRLIEAFAEDGSEGGAAVDIAAAVVVEFEASSALLFVRRKAGWDANVVQVELPKENAAHG